MLENRKMATAKDVFLMIANIWLLRRLDHICPLNSVHGGTQNPQTSKFAGVVLLPSPKDTLLLKVYEPLPEKRKLGVESNANVQKFKDVGSKARFSWIFQNGPLASSTRN